jgi:ankyrin repeat protein
MKKMLHVTVLLTLALAAVANPATARPGAVKAGGGKAQPEDCGCVANPGPHQMTMAQAKRAATPDVVSLFDAASEGDEATFARLISTVGDINDFVIDDDKLLHALLRPAASLRADHYRWTEGNHDAERTLAHARAERDRHQALLPAKTRMLALALQHGAAVNDGDRFAYAAALHLAAAYGTRDMVELLVRHGADVLQLGGQNHNLAPLGYTLYLKDAAVKLAELITPDERTAIALALFAAGAQRPYLHVDTREPMTLMRPGAKGTAPVPWKMADFMWDPMLQVTTGTALLDKMEQAGTTPYAEDEEKSPYAYAAEAGNAAAIGWLKNRVPRFDKAGNDRWLDAAMWALYLPEPAADAVLAQLLVKDMRWAQQGPMDEGSVAGYRPLQRNRAIEQHRDNVLAHAARAGRADWVARLVALGAKPDKDGKEELAAAVEQGNPATVTLLLRLGADPLAGDPSALQRALYGGAGLEFEPDYRGGGLPKQAPVLVPLLLKHIVEVQKKPLAALDPSPLDEAAEKVARPGGAARMRLLLDAGFPADGLSERAATVIFATRDRALANTLLDQGMLRSAPERARAAGTDSLLRWAVQEGHGDLLARLMQLGYDPNGRSGTGRSAVDEAIALGAAADLATLLAGGGRIDTAARDAQGGGVLDFAVASGNEAVLRQVTGNLAVRLNHVCLPDPQALVKTVRNAPNAYWDLLRRQGFATDGKACPDMAQRVVKALVDTPSRVTAGWLGENLRVRLPQLGVNGAGRADIGAAVWPMLAQAKRDDLRLLLEQAGWPAPAVKPAPPAPLQSPAARALDAALRKTVPGAYYLEGEREVGSQIVLRANGTFAYELSYGAVDEAAQGTWTVLDRRVVLRTPAPTARTYTLTTATPAGGPKGELVVRLGDDTRLMQGLTLTLLGDAPLMAVGKRGQYGWTAHLPGPVRQLVVSSTGEDALPAVVIDVPAALGLEGTFMLTPDAAWRPTMTLNISLESKDGGLVLPREGGRGLFYKRAPARRQ